MSPSSLATAIRERQLAAGLQPAEAINSLNDAELIGCATDCPHCLGSLFPDPAAAVRQSADAGGFLNKCNAAIEAHKCRVAMS